MPLSVEDVVAHRLDDGAEFRNAILRHPEVAELRYQARDDEVEVLVLHSHRHRPGVRRAQVCAAVAARTARDEGDELLHPSAQTLQIHMDEEGRETRVLQDAVVEPVHQRINKMRTEVRVERGAREGLGLRHFENGNRAGTDARLRTLTLPLESSRL